MKDEMGDNEMASNRIKATAPPRLPINKVRLGEWNVRTSDKEKGIEELAESIQRYGLLQPIVVFREGDKFNLVIGQRRLRAFRELKKTRRTEYGNIPAVVLERKPDEETLKVLSLSQNIQRVELNRADIADVISYLYTKQGRSAKKVASILGKSIPYVYEYLKIHDAPQEIREMLSRREISKQDVKRVMEIAPGDEPKMVELARKMKALAGPEKARLVDAGRRRPRARATELIQEARKPRIEEKVIVPLTPDLIMALDSAVKQIGLSRQEIAKKALRDWLADKGYFRQSR